MDKKLTKNILKRCIVDPICERLLKQQHNVDEAAASEIEAFYGSNSKVLQAFNRVLVSLSQVNSLLTPNLKEWLALPLK